MSVAAGQLNTEEHTFGHAPNALSEAWVKINPTPDNDNFSASQRLDEIKAAGEANLALARAWEDALAPEATNDETPEKVFMLMPNQFGRLTGMWIDPDSPYDMAIIAEDYDLALVLAEDALLENPKDSGALFDKAYAMVLQGFPLKALEYYEAVIAHDPTNYAAWHNMGNIMFETGDYDKAQEYYQKAIGQDPLSIMSRLYLAETLAINNDMDGYYEQLEAVQGIVPSEPTDLLALEDFTSDGSSIAEILEERLAEEAAIAFRIENPEAPTGVAGDELVPEELKPELGL